jgi:DNA-binding transcriptional LysR family regulator
LALVDGGGRVDMGSKNVDVLSAMQAFARVYETGSFSAAAKRLGLGQPSTSRLVAQLEEHLGTKLLIRSTRGLSPTDAGTRYYEQALRTLEAADLAERAARGAGGALSGRLRVSATISLMRRHIIPRLPSFYAAHPALELDLLLDDRDVGLVEEGVEVALRMGKLASSGLTARQIGQSRRLVVGATDYFRQHGQPRQPEDLARHDAVIFSRREGGQQLLLTRAGQTREVTLRPRLRVSVLEGLRAAILAGVGLGVATEWILGAELNDGRLTVALPEWELPPIELWAIFPGGRQASAAARAFVAFVEATLAATPFAIRAP